MSTFGTGTTTTGGSSIVLTAFSGTNGVQAGTDGLVQLSHNKDMS